MPSNFEVVTVGELRRRYGLGLLQLQQERQLLLLHGTHLARWTGMRPARKLVRLGHFLPARNRVVGDTHDFGDSRLQNSFAD
mgnify:CR=1 FL=1